LSRFRIAVTVVICSLFIVGCGQRAADENVPKTDGKTKQNLTVDFATLGSLQFNRFSSDNGLPCDEVQVVYQDREGYIWIGTRFGLFQYDGFQIKSFKNKMKTPDLLTSDFITCLKDDEHNLWIGTMDGLNRMDKRTGEMKHYHFTDLDNCKILNSILITTEHQVWVGTDGGLYTYDARRDTFFYYHRQHPNVLFHHCSIKSMCEDGKGYIWVGTWDHGLYRYDTKNDKWYAMPKFNDVNSAHVVFIDSKGRLWVGTWGAGLFRIDNPYATGEPLKLVRFVHNEHSGNIAGNTIFTLAEDPKTSSLWIGGRSGLSICRIDDPQPEGFINYPRSDNPSEAYMGRGIGSLVLDHNGRMWMISMGEGVISTTTCPRYFTNYGLGAIFPKGDVDRIMSLCSDGSNGLLIGLNTKGVERMSADGSVSNITQNITNKDKISTVYALCRTSDGRTLTGTWFDGLFVSGSHGVRNYNHSNTSWLPDNCIYCFHDEGDGSVLIGTWAGLCVLLPDGSGRNLTERCGTLGQAQIQHIMKDADGYWLSTKNEGIVHLAGNVKAQRKLNCTTYTWALTDEGDTVRFNDVQKSLRDARGRLWACSNQTGLMLWDAKGGHFTCVNGRYDIADENVNNMEQDRNGNLWLSTNYGLVRLSVSDDARRANLRIFSKLDGVGANYFGNGSSCRLDDGRLCFCNIGNITMFHPDAIHDEYDTHPACITDIKIFNQSLGELDREVLAGITDALPPFTRKITLEPSQNDLTLEFSTLTYDNPQATRFAYRLDGYDKGWIYAEAGKHTAYYSKLPPGTYTFSMKATDAKGLWSNNIQSMTIVVLPPLYLRWWAFVIYLLLAAAIVVLTVRYLRVRERRRRERIQQDFERKQADELNHKKLQFFTNVTHDLMTPLTIISAAVEEMKAERTDIDEEDVNVINNNLSRLMHLLQQILAFRKSETGNLHLCVAEGDLADFCRKEAESIMPLMKSKGLTLSYACEPECIKGYFDSDVLDKILYNLLSNAAKYSRTNGFVKLSLTQADEEGHVMLTVADNGHGIAKERQKELFKRFYEGEHRRFNTYGTGIGLSLTKDYVDLCHGTISVESEEEKGTRFIIDLPIAKELFSKDEMQSERSIIISGDEAQPVSDMTDNAAAEEDAADGERTTVLLVEDNEELLSLMVRLLKRRYRVLTAVNGQQAIETVKAQEMVDIIVSDVMMPVMDGIAMTQQLKGDIETSHIPIILLTAKRTDDDRTEAYNVGADGYITKPFQLSLLEARISNLLRKKELSADRFKNKFVVELSDMELTDIDKDFMNHCIACMDKHIADADFDQQMFAVEVGVSYSTLYKKLKSITDMGPSTFMRNIRMKAACRIMDQGGNMRVSDLAYAVGYNSPRYFSTCFKQDFGMLPSEYMEHKAEKS
jgi:signal transduction histidine kinase/ligand-binding sensor domain-containing protein/CheY-like chemotaxis protein/AraC-like DNA-binding protein